MAFKRDDYDELKEIFDSKMPGITKKQWLRGAGYDIPEEYDEKLWEMSLDPVERKGYLYRWNDEPYSLRDEPDFFELKKNYKKVR